MNDQITKTKSKNLKLPKLISQNQKQPQTHG